MCGSHWRSPEKLKDSRGGLADGGGKCKGAPKKTSGRSSSWSAPLRATSSDVTNAHRVPFRKSLKTQKVSSDDVVGIALGWERFTPDARSAPGTRQRAVEKKTVQHISFGRPC